MDELHDDRKKEEEEYGGFEPEDSNEDSFVLDDDSEYPSKLPSNFSDEDDPEPESIEEIKKSREEESQGKPEVEKGKSAKNIGGDADTIVAFDKIDADKPSNYGLPPIAESGDINQKHVDEIHQEDDSKKKLPVWMLMLYTAAATFILTSALAIIIWQAYLNDEEKVEEKQTTEAMGENKMIPADTIDEQEDDEEITDRELLEKFEDDTSDFESKQQVSPEKLNEVDKTKKDKKDKSKKDLAAKSSKVPKTDKKFEKPKEPAKQLKTDTKERNFSMPQPEGPPPEKGIYTVQIYSSPSLEDAERWLERLENKDIKSGFISKHVIRDKTWYRVRYGEFETKQEARASALEMGFSQSWIDRVK